MKILKIIALVVIYFLVEVGCVALGWNMFLVKVFECIPVLGFSKLCLLTVALTFLSAPFRSYKRSKND